MFGIVVVGICLLFSFSFQSPSSPFNASSKFIFPPTNTHINDQQPPPPSSSHFFQDVLTAISAKQGWKSEQIRVSSVDVKNARVGISQRYEFRIRMGKSDLFFKFSEELDSSWKKLRKNGDFATLLNKLSSQAVLNSFQLDGPFELTVHAHDHLTLLLPLNTTHTGLKRLLVGEGITVEVEGAREVSFFHVSDFGSPINRSLNISEESNQFWPFRHSSCMSLPPIHVFGSASVVAYRSRNPSSHIETASLSRDTVELLPEKCYGKYSYKNRACPIHGLSRRLALVEKLMKSFLGDRITENGMSGYLKAKIRSSTLVEFQMELEREIRDDDLFWGSVAEWRTKPTSERVQFEVIARVEAERLRPVAVKKRRPLMLADSTSWSTLMSNISFTKFPAVLVPPEALTLDVKW